MEILLSKCYEWMNTPELWILAEQFGGKFPKELTNKEKLLWLAEFSKVWDFRESQKSAYDSTTGEKARWLVDNAGLTEQQISYTEVAAKSLGLVGCSKPDKKIYDYIVVLGGARMACYFRIKYAKELIDKYKISAKEIVGLTGMRPVLESEREATDRYALGADTEFDLMCSAIRSVFVKVDNEILKKELNENINSSWAISQYKSKIPIMVLAAPSSEPNKRRANTSDTFNFWIKQSEPQIGENVLLITSQIYVPYQQTEAARILGMMYGYSVETIGFPIEWNLSIKGFQKAANYLQEIRSTLLSMSKLLNEENKILNEED